jgi:hypothetical protein
LGFHSFGLFSEHLGDAFTPPPFMTFLPNTRSILSSWPTTYQSVLDLTLYPQIAFPSEISSLPFHATEATLPN